jgi:hypothetical protein
MRKLACGLALVAFATLYANAQLALYDDFNTTFINPDKWVVNQTGNDASREYVKEQLSAEFHALPRTGSGDPQKKIMQSNRL